MIELFLLRHAHAVERGDPRCPEDFERPLTLEGANRTRRAARALRALGVQPDLVITSPYLRATQTARLVASECGVPPELLREAEALLPAARPDALWRLLGELRAERVLCVGHAPSLGRFLSAALGTATNALSLKKAGAAHLTATLGPTPRGRLVWLLPPRLLRNFAPT